MSRAFQIPGDFRAYMREIVVKLDWGDASAHVSSSGELRFTYDDPSGGGRWEVVLHEQQVRDIAAGNLDEIAATLLADGTRITRGEPLLVWGEYDEDALRVRSTADLAIALDALHGLSVQAPCLVRLWSASDDQAVAVLSGPDVALYVVSGMYGRSIGDAARSDQLDVVSDDVGALEVPGSDCVTWSLARQALLHFAEHGELGAGVTLDGSIPTQLIMLGDFDRDAELESRRPPPADPALSSLPHKAPQGLWARRLVRSLLDLHLIEIDDHILDTIVARVAILLIERGDDAIDSAEVAGLLARDLERVRGIGALFATGGDLQIALRRTQDAPTSPVDAG